MTVYYNEHDQFAAAWLRELMREGLIPDGEVDTRSILDVRAEYLRGFTQLHFFAGIGGWPLALRLAGWADDRPVVTGSCPCQPLSSAGQRRAHADERHLWPAFHDLIAQCEIPIVFGEQVASDLGREWCSGVRADLEALGHAFGAADLCAASVGAPHIRQRIFWVSYAKGRGRGVLGGAPGAGSERHLDQRGVADGMADGGGDGRDQQQGIGGEQDGAGLGRDQSSDGSGDGSRLADAELPGPSRQREHRRSVETEEGLRGGPSPGGGNGGLDHAPGGQFPQQERGSQTRNGPRSTGAALTGADRDDGRMGNPESIGGGLPDRRQDRGEGAESERPSEAGRLGDPEGTGLSLRTWQPGNDGAAGRPYPWQGFEQAGTVPIRCSDGKWRRVPANQAGQPEPALFPLAHAGTVRNRVGTLRGSGNAINPFVAAAFIKAARQAIEEA